MHLIFFLLISIGGGSTHVSLTFPPARLYNLDYLDSSGSPPPCGMPKGSLKTSLVSGSTFNATWHLGYPHQGSHRLELLSSNGSLLYTLVSETDSDDPTATRQVVSLPSKLTCTDCIIRLLRQSVELGNPFYWFWSCGDVDIVSPSQYKETCSDRGRLWNGACTCPKGFFGKRCEYENECEDEEDCNNNGECIDLGGTNLPRKQCFCKKGFIGKRCGKQNSEGNTPLPTRATLKNELKSKAFRKKVLDPRFTIYWRILNETVKTIEFVLKVNGTSYVGLGWRPVDFQGDCTRYPSNDASTSRKRRQVNSKIKSEGNEPYIPLLHPMSCTDVVIGSARGNLYRILDYWSGDISTPREDSLWDGTDDIESGGGWESKRGITTIIFRKRILSKDIGDSWNDWDLQGSSHVIWARGQEAGEYVHSLPSGLDGGENKPSVPLFYTADEIKYHGFRDQRGTTRIEFMKEN